MKGAGTESESEGCRGGVDVDAAKEDQFERNLKHERRCTVCNSSAH